MNNKQLIIAIFCSIVTNVYSVYASEEKATAPYPFSDIDKRIFRENSGIIASPYSSAFVKSLSLNFVMAEHSILSTLYSNALTRINVKTSMPSSDILLSNSLSEHINTLTSTHEILLQLPSFVHHITISQFNMINSRVGNPIDTSIALMPEYCLMLLLQWSYGIKRNGSTAQIILSSDSLRTVTVPPVLMDIIEKYREHENN